MRRPETFHLTCRGPPVRQRQWAEALARLIAASTAPVAALLECSSTEPDVRFTVRPPELVDTVVRSLAGRSVVIGRCAAPAPSPPPAAVQGRIATLVRTGAVRSERPEEPGPAVDRIGVRAGTPPLAWLGLQTFWLPGPRGHLWLARRFWFAAPTAAGLDRRLRAAGAALAAEWSLSAESPATFRPDGFRGRGEWFRGGVSTIPPEGWFARPPSVVARTARFPGPEGEGRADLPVETPAIVLGASGAGKTTYLARWGARVVREGGGLFAIDLHGDLAPAILARLPPASRGRVVAIDATSPPLPGIAGIAPGASRDRSAAHLVAALKRLSPDGTDLYWGFRLERIFDTFARLALESGGTLTDLYDLLTSADRRDTARLATRSAELARFLDELAPVVRRNPEFLWSAATRLSKVVLVPALRDLLAPEEGGLAVEELLARGRAILVRIPFATLGPEAAGFAATLVLGRVYLGIAAAAPTDGRTAPVAVVLDEVQAISPRLVAELLTEGRKFGVRAIVATQYPDRLSRELEAAARGALRGFVSFRVPPASAPSVGAWLGLHPADATDLLPNLPTGEGVVVDSLSDGLRPTAPEAASGQVDRADWEDAVAATRKEFPVPPSPGDETGPEDVVTERLLLAVLSQAEAGPLLRREHAVEAAARLPGTGPDPVHLGHRLETLLRERTLLDDTEGALRLTPAGERWLGLTAPTGAARESAEHRALLLGAFRLLARRGYRLEILRQGRFDTTLPDARLRQLPGRERLPVPADVADELDRAREGWAWAFFHGRDVHVEAEVSGALRPERVRHGLRKALSRGAFALFVVGDAGRARRVRTVLRAMGLGVDRAQVWTLHVGAGAAERGSRTNR